MLQITRNIELIMGLTFYVASHESTINMVNNEDFNAIDEFIENPVPFVGPMDDWVLFFPGFIVKLDPSLEWVSSVNQIASRATELNKPNVLRHIAERIEFDYKRDGNSYDLFVLAIEKGHFELIDVLWQIALEYHWYKVAKEKLEYALERVFSGDTDYNNNEDIILEGIKHIYDKDICLYNFYNTCKHM